ncbi:MAG: PAS domain S-box protein [Bacteroidales bacterium]|nr:PAS domain S-box protein [Bacteroidales bacterium]
MNIINISDKKRILVIDDNVQIHHDFKKVLLVSTESENNLDKLEEVFFGESSTQQEEAYLIDCAVQGEEGLEMIEESLKKEEPYAVAFVDVRMPPGLDGIETISKIWEIYPDIQIVICTAYSDYSWQDMCDKFGNTENLLILKKPFDNIEVRQLAYTLSRKWELNKIANLKMNELEKIVEERTKELQHSEEKYRTMIENSNDMIWTLDKKGNFVYINKKSEYVSGYKINEKVGKAFIPIILEEDLEMVEKIFQDTLSGNSNHYEVRIYSATKEKIHTLSVNTTPIIKDGEVTGTVSFGRDITESKQAEEKIQQQNLELQDRNEELNDFAHTVAHDLKNPLGVIIGFSELLEEEFSNLSEEEIKDYIKQIVHDSNRMNNIINDLILFSSLRKIEIKIEVINMSDVVSKAINSLSQMIERSNAEITFPDTFPSVLGYSSWVEQVWVNYISNAIKFGGKPLRIKLTADTGKTNNVPEGMVRFCVRDNGLGISLENQTRLFKKFERLDQVQIKGSGLGLSIVRRLIKKLGGQVGVESEIGKGSLFYFTLPIDGH